MATTLEETTVAGNSKTDDITFATGGNFTLAKDGDLLGGRVVLQQKINGNYSPVVQGQDNADKSEIEIAEPANSVNFSIGEGTYAVAVEGKRIDSGDVVVRISDVY